jgi:hypothetical protein
LITNAQENCPILEHIKSLIAIEAHEHDGKTYISNRVVEVPEHLAIAQHINTKRLFWDYLTVNYSDVAHVRKIADVQDSLERVGIYFESLLEDSLYTSTIREYSNKVIRQTVAKDTIKMSELLGIASKFFSIQHITNEGNFSTAICVGRNDIKKTETQKRPLIEAFAFFAIFNDIETGKFDIYAQFHEKVKQLYSISLGTNNEEKLLRAQGAIYMLMMYNSSLPELLLDTYKSYESELPFVLVE